MGYYLDFIFDEPGITHEEVIKKTQRGQAKEVLYVLFITGMPRIQFICFSLTLKMNRKT